MPSGPRVIVFAGGDPPPRSVLEVIASADYVIAADSGLDHALRLGVTVDLLVGDLDSVSLAGVAQARRIQQHPADKDATDLAIALEAAVGLGPETVVVVGGHGGRIDHLLANAALLAAPEHAALDLVWLAGTARVYAIHHRRELTGQPGDLLTLLPYGGPATGVSTSGLRWRLHGATLNPGTTRGVSNEFTAAQPLVTVSTGVLLAVHIPVGPPP
jgi:thiamine pyrophosphokinase